MKPRHAFGQLRAQAGDEGVRLTCFYTAAVFSAGRRASRARLRLSRPTIRIHRRCLPAFTWGRDYAEYFDGLDVSKARVLFEGALEPVNERKFEFLDAQVRTGRTYVYWVSGSAGREPTGPIAVRVRDRRVWWPHQEIEGRLAALARAHPIRVSLARYGTTVGGLPIMGLRAGNRARCLALVGAVHAGESGPELMITALEALLKEQAALLDRVGVAILPCVNADERERLVGGCPWYLRTNARGVDLNRNFDAVWDDVGKGYGLLSDDPDSATYRGPHPVSEPETQAAVKFLETVRPAAVFSYHALASVTGASLLAPKSAEHDARYAEACQRVVSAFVGAFCGRRRWNAGLHLTGSAGSLPAYVYRAFGAPAFDLSPPRVRPVNYTIEVDGDSGTGDGVDMPRRWRMRYAGAKYPLTARGNGRDQVFFGAEDYARFVKQLGAALDLCCRYSGATQRAVAAHFGYRSEGAVGKSRRVAQAALAADAALARQAARAEKRLQEGKS